MENSVNILLRLAEDSMDQRKQKEERIIELEKLVTQKGEKIIELEKLVTEAQTKIENDKGIIENLQKKLQEKETQLKILQADYPALSATNKVNTNQAKKRKATQIKASDCDEDFADGRPTIPTLFDGDSDESFY